MPCAFRVQRVRRSGEEPTWYAPVPQESIVFMSGWEGAREVKTPSDIVERPGRGGLVVVGEEGRGGRTDVAEADEEDGDGFGGYGIGHGGCDVRVAG